MRQKYTSTFATIVLNARLQSARESTWACYLKKIERNWPCAHLLHFKACQETKKEQSLKTVNI